MPVAPDETSQAQLETLQRATFQYFLQETNPANGLVPDSTKKGTAASIAAVGFALACYPVGVARGYIDRASAADRVLTTLRFFWTSEQSESPTATGYRGFYYHFLDMESGRRVWKCELSTVDTALFLAGMLTAAQYFDGTDETEAEIRDLSDALNRRVEWDWATNPDAETKAHAGLGVTHGWRPEEGFLKARWCGYNEAIILYALALGSPTHAVGPEHYAAWLETYKWKKLYGIEHLWSGPLFVHQFSHVWIDFRGLQDAYMRDKGIDYFENSRRATYVQQAYAMRNTRGRKGYGEFCWGITASDGPGPARHRVGGETIEFYDYRARHVPWGPDDGTLAPWAAVASLPFAPEIVLPTLRHVDEQFPEMMSTYGYKCSFNPTFPDGADGWISQGYYGIDQGPVVLMIENYWSGLVWELMRTCAPLVTGLKRCGFTGGWLDED